MTEINKKINKIFIKTKKLKIKKNNKYTINIIKTKIKYIKKEKK